MTRVAALGGASIAPLADEERRSTLFGRAKRFCVAVHPGVEAARAACQEPLVSTERFAHVDDDARYLVAIIALEKVELCTVSGHSMAVETVIFRRELSASGRHGVEL